MHVTSKVLLSCPFHLRYIKYIASINGHFSAVTTSALISSGGAFVAGVTGLN
jgi:hypothetical protein